MCTNGLAFLCADCCFNGVGTIKIQLSVGLIESKDCHILYKKKVTSFCLDIHVYKQLSTWQKITITSSFSKVFVFIYIYMLIAFEMSFIITDELTT